MSRILSARERCSSAAGQRRLLHGVWRRQHRCADRNESNGNRTAQGPQGPVLVVAQNDLVLRLVGNHARAILRAEHALEEGKIAAARIAVNEAMEYRDSLALIQSQIATWFLARTLVRYIGVIIEVTKQELK